jgi:serine/threonine-protein kinase
VNAQGWQEVKSLFARAMELPQDSRLQWLEASRASDEAVLAEVRRLIQNAEETLALSGGALSRSGRDGGRAAARLLNPGYLLAERFEIQGFLGSGGMGEVYSATDKELAMPVATKVIRAEYAARADFVHRLKREVQIARRLNNPNLCRVYDVHRIFLPDTGETVALSMELLHGGTLSEYLRRGPLPLARALSILKGIAAGIDAAHAAGILHRDLKGANIILIEEGETIRPVITDFGLSREIHSLEETQSLFGPGSIAGTPAYMAPEQLLGQELSARTDIYSLGVIGFEMATGRLPFEGETALAIALRRLQEQAPAARRFRQDLPESWDAAIRACLSAKPERRPASGAAFIQLLNRAPVRGRRLVRRTFFVSLGALAAAEMARFWPRAAHHPPEAVASVKRGEEFARRRNQEGIQNAIQEFRRAVQLDSRYAEAWSGLADAYVAALHYDLLNPNVARTEAKRAAETALQLDSHSGIATGALAYIQSVDFEHWRSAEPLFTRALRLAPNEAVIFSWYAAYLGRLGRFSEALAQAHRALEIEPASFYCNHQLAAELFRARRFDDYFRQAEELVRLQPFEASSYLTLARACEWLGQYERGLQCCDEAAKYRKSPVAACYRATIEAARGNRDAAVEIAKQMRPIWQNGPFESSLLTHLYARLNAYADVMDIIDQAFARGDPTVLACPTDAYLDGLRTLPRYRAFLRRLGFQPS